MTLPRTLAIAALLAASPILFAGAVGGKYEPSILRVRVTRQSHDFIRPWQKVPPKQASGKGVVIGPDRILVPGNLLANATLVEVERIGDGTRCEAVVECADYVANLGLIRAKEDAFAKQLKPVAIRTKGKRGDRVTAVQFEPNGTPSISEGRIKTAEVTTPTGAAGRFLVYRVSIDLKLGHTGIVPFFRRGKLIGLMVSYDKSGRTATLIPSPVIGHFLADLGDGTYDGFPEAGFGSAAIQDPQLRRYLGMTNGDPGVYISQVIPGSAAAKAGMVKGDVLVKLDSYTVNRHGQYDDPEYGPMAISHLIKTRRQVGDPLLCTVRRGEETLELTATLEHLAADEYPVPPYVIGRPPRFVIVGGFVFQELSRQLLGIWGKEWRTKAPRHLTRIDREQWERRQPGEQVVILSRVLPTPENIGFENLSFRIVKTVNGKAVNSVRELAEVVKKAGPTQYHTVLFENSSLPELTIKAATLDLANRFVRERYRIPHLSQLD